MTAHCRVPHVGTEHIIDASELVEEIVLEIEAEYEDPTQIPVENVPRDQITGVFDRHELSGT